jgi:hypothetical protein
MRNVAAVSDLNVSVRAAGDIPDLIGAAYGLDGVLLREADLDPAFFDLRTGLLGELFQKCVNYRLAVAFVVPDPAAHGERFTELAREHAAHPQIRFCRDEAAAWAWLRAGG